MVIRILKTAAVQVAAWCTLIGVETTSPRDVTLAVCSIVTCATSPMILGHQTLAMACGARQVFEYEPSGAKGLAMLRRGKRAARPTQICTKI